MSFHLKILYIRAFVHCYTRWRLFLQKKPHRSFSTQLRITACDAFWPVWNSSPSIVHRKQQHRAWKSNSVLISSRPKPRCSSQKERGDVFVVIVLGLCSPAAMLAWVMEEEVMPQLKSTCGLWGVRNQWAPVRNGIGAVGGLVYSSLCVCVCVVALCHICHERWLKKLSDVAVVRECHDERWWQGRPWCAHCGSLWKNRCSDWMTDCHLSLSLLRCNYWGGIAMFLRVINPDLTAQRRCWWPRPVESTCCAEAAV